MKPKIDRIALILLVCGLSDALLRSIALLYSAESSPMFTPFSTPLPLLNQVFYFIIEDWMYAVPAYLGGAVLFAVLLRLALGLTKPHRWLFVLLGVLASETVYLLRGWLVESMDISLPLIAYFLLIYVFVGSLFGFLCFQNKAWGLSHTPS